MKTHKKVSKPILTPITVSITQEIIDKSIPGSPFSCPLALALREIGFKKVVVLPKTGISCDRFKSELPEEITEYLLFFDEHQTQNPITFELKVKLWDRIEDPKRDRRSSGDLLERAETLHPGKEENV